MEGWISLYRKFIDWEWYEDINTKSVFIHCLLKANNEQKEWRGETIKRGQFFTSIKNLSKELKLTDKQVRIALDKLESTKEISKKGANKGTWITVCKYDSYQDNLKSRGRTKGKQRATTNKENKEIKEGDSKKFVPPTIKMIKDYSTEKGYSIDAQKVFNYYDVSNWVDSKGNKVRNWKQKVLSVWCKPENKIVKESIEDLYLNHYNENKKNTAANNYAFLLKQKKDILYTFDNIITIDEFSKLKINGNLETVIISFQNYGRSKDEFLTNLGIHVRKY